MSKFKGFTLVELMVTLAVLAIIVAIAAPSFSSIIKNNRLTTQSNALVASLAMARSESAKRKIAVSICASSDQSTCTGNWQDGWIVFVDSDGSNAFNDDSDANLCEVNTENRPAEDCLLKTQEALSGNPTLLNSPSVSFISYQPMGASSSSPTFTLKPSECSGNESRAIIIGPTGRPYAGTSPVACV